MMENKEILKQLESIVFHDIPVEYLELKVMEEVHFRVCFALYQEDKKEYDYWELSFLEIETFESDYLSLDREVDMEITSFNYEFDTCYNCEIEFLLGSSKPSLIIEMNCKTITLKPIKLF